MKLNISTFSFVRLADLESELGDLPYAKDKIIPSCNLLDLFWFILHSTLDPIDMDQV